MYPKRTSLKKKEKKLVLSAISLLSSKKAGKVHNPNPALLGFNVV